MIQCCCCYCMSLMSSWRGTKSSLYIIDTDTYFGHMYTFDLLSIGVHTHFLIVLRYFDLNLSVWSPALVSNPRCCLPNLLAFTSVCMSVCMCMCVRQWLGSCILYWKSWGLDSVFTQENNISNHDLSHLFIFYQSFLLLSLYMIIIIIIGQIFISL